MAQFDEARAGVEPTDVDKGNARSAYEDVRSLLESNDRLSLAVDRERLGDEQRMG